MLGAGATAIILIFLLALGPSAACAVTFVVGAKRVNGGLQ